MMGKLTTYLIMMSGLMLLFYFTGLIQECNEDGLCEAKTPNGALMNMVLHPENMQESALYLKITLAMSGLALAGAVILSKFIGNLDLVVIAPVAIYMFTLMWDFIVVFQKVREANPVLAILFFAPILILYVVTIIEWWRGID